MSRFAVILAGLIIGALSGSVVALPSHNPDNIVEVQQLLKPDEVILEYFLNDSSVQVKAIAQESTFLATRTLDQLFWSSLKSFRKKLKSAEPRGFSIPGEILYLFLIEPLQEFLTGRHRLIIITDERLSGLPFEAFIRNDCMVEGDNACHLHYLIHDYEVVYQCSMERLSASLITRSMRRPDIAGEGHFAFMGFSPAFAKSGYASALPDSKAEISEIGGLFRQKGLSSSLVCDEASFKENFIETASRGKIVHLATHYKTEGTGSNPGGFLFSDYLSAGDSHAAPVGLLTKDEFKVLQLKADLIVLNACGSYAYDRTATSGNSLPAILLMSGVKNILSTLWSVTDNLSKHFMLEFYRSMLSGKTYSEALREVKLQWINCSETTIPAIWAPYVIVGE